MWVLKFPQFAVGLPDATTERWGRNCRWPLQSQDGAVLWQLEDPQLKRFSHLSTYAFNSLSQLTYLKLIYK